MVMYKIDRRGAEGGSKNRSLGRTQYVSVNITILKVLFYSTNVYNT